jgi:hypothetical protein
MKFFIILFSLAVAPCLCRADIHPSAGGESFEFLKITHGAYYTAMGNAGIALGNDASSFYWNPANIASAKKKNLATSAQIYDWDLGMNFGYVDFNMPFPKEYAGAVFLQYNSYGSFPVTNETGDSLGSFTASSLAGGFGLARQIGSLSLGLALKGIYTGIDTNSSSGVAADLGFNWQTPVQSLTVAGVLQNLGPQPSSFLSPAEGGLRFPLPSSFTLGLGWKMYGLERSNLAFDLYKPFRDYLHYRLGLDLSLGNNLFLRLGYQMPSTELAHGFSSLFNPTKSSGSSIDADSLATEYYRSDNRSFSLGAGFKQKNFRFDFSYTFRLDGFSPPLEGTLVYFFGK